MKLFIRNILLISIPFILMLVYLILIFFFNGLYIPYLKRNINEPFILGEPYSESYAANYKINKNLKDVKIIAIGSSRVLEFSADMFTDKFFNLGYTVSSIYQTYNLIENLDLKNKTIIVGIDQWEFNTNWPNINDSTPPDCNINSLSVLLNSNEFNDILKGKVYPKKITSNNQVLLIGSGANLGLSGILNDGSYYYGKSYHGLLNNNSELIGQDYEFSDTRNRIKAGNRRFEFGATADYYSIAKLQKLITRNKERKNKLILFFPPFAPSIVKELSNSKYSYITDASTKISKLCDSTGIHFYDFTNVAATDADFVDGVHGGKLVYYNILKQTDIPSKNCIFINQFESTADSLYTKLRIKTFSNLSYPKIGLH